MTIPLADAEGALEPSAAETVLERAARSDALVLGPGLGRQPGAFELARILARAAELPVLIDADGLNAHAHGLRSLAERNAPTVLTPHAGELARLLGTESGQVESHRLAMAREAAAESGAIVVLKGDDTLVVSPDGAVGVSRGGSSALATAGTGDILSGVIAAYLAKHMDPFHAACAGVFVHSQAGQLAARAIGEEGVIARDVIELLPRALAAGEAQSE
jgi:NAD(P)H-hydrate epimerase